MVENTCGLITGRVIEIRVGAGYRTVADVEDMIRMLTLNMAKVPVAEKCVIAADWRAVHLMPPDVAARVREMISGSNPRVLRSSILTLPESPLTNLQAVRLVREAENPNRRHFTSTKEMHAWLAEVLTPTESARVKTFLASS